jgi:hypothetical protein
MKLRKHPCEAELGDGKFCGKLTAWQSVYAFNSKEKRFMWLCDECKRGVEEAVTKAENSA